MDSIGKRSIDAIIDLADELKPDCDVSKLVADIAKEYDLKPEFLVRKFTEQTGVTPEHYLLTLKARQEISVAERAATAKARAYKREIQELAARMNVSPSMVDDFLNRKRKR